MATTAPRVLRMQRRNNGHVHADHPKSQCDLLGTGSTGTRIFCGMHTGCRSPPPPCRALTSIGCIGGTICGCSSLQMPTFAVAPGFQDFEFVVRVFRIAHVSMVFVYILPCRTHQRFWSSLDVSHFSRAQRRRTTGWY